MQTSPGFHHEPVMPSEVVTLLKAREGGVFVDYTVGAGGHARTLLETGAERVVGFDRDAFGGYWSLFVSPAGDSVFVS